MLDIKDQTITFLKRNDFKECYIPHSNDYMKLPPYCFHRNNPIFFFYHHITIPTNLLDNTTIKIPFFFCCAQQG